VLERALSLVSNKIATNCATSVAAPIQAAPALGERHFGVAVTVGDQGLIERRLARCDLKRPREPGRQPQLPWRTAELIVSPELCSRARWDVEN
jgi:hypothetical protein